MINGASSLVAKIVKIIFGLSILCINVGYMLTTGENAVFFMRATIVICIAWVNFNIIKNALLTFDE